METLGPKHVLEYAKRFGFEEDFPPYLPIALGAGDATLLDITSAYTAFPNQGVRMKPFSVLNVKDRDGNLLEENRSEPSDVIRADTAYVMTNMLRGVLSLRGTGARAASMAAEWPLAGKTGTVDENTDAWFVGFDPDITVGVWIGFDDKRKSLGTAEQGAFAALPMWMEFMRGYIDGRPDKGRSARLRRAGQHRVPARRQDKRRTRGRRIDRRHRRGVHLRHAARRPESRAVAQLRARNAERGTHNEEIEASLRSPFYVLRFLLSISVASGTPSATVAPTYASPNGPSTAIATTTGCSGGSISLMPQATAAPAIADIQSFAA